MDRKYKYKMKAWVRIPPGSKSFCLFENFFAFKIHVNWVKSRAKIRLRVKARAKIRLKVKDRARIRLELG